MGKRKKQCNLNRKRRPSSNAWTFLEAADDIADDLHNLGFSDHANR